LARQARQQGQQTEQKRKEMDGQMSQPQALAQITAQDALNWFAYCGYSFFEMV
jgi:hypothetical protein